MIAIIATSILIFLVWILFRHGKSELLMKHIPGPTSIPLLGNALMFLGKNPIEIMKMSTTLKEKYGNFFRFSIISEVAIIITDPRDVETMLTSQAMVEKSYEYNPLIDWLGTGLLISHGRKWHSRRKILTPAFHFHILDQFVETFNKHSSVLVENLSRFVGTEIDVFPHVANCALDVICETSMGVQVNAQADSESAYVRAVKEMTSIISIRHFNFFMRSNFLFRLSPLYRKQKKLLHILHGFTDSVITARRDERKKSLISDNQEIDDVGAKKKMALLDVLLQSTIDGKPLTNSDIREEVDTFMFEGHDTVTSAISFCLYNLAKHPEIQQRAYNEVVDVFGTDSAPIVTMEKLGSLKCIELVIKESLRLFPPVQFLGRLIREEFYLNGKFIPKNVTVGMGLFLMGRDPKIHKNPEVFWPERFLPVNADQNPFAYVPFSAGPRNCIGQKFAMLEIKSVLAKILRSFKLEVRDDFEPSIIAEIILQPSNGILLTFLRRDTMLPL